MLSNAKIHVQNIRYSKMVEKEKDNSSVSNKYQLGSSFCVTLCEYSNYQNIEEQCR